MTLAIVWPEPAYKQLRKLPILIQRAIVKKLDEAVQQPEHFFTRYVGRPYHKLRIGDYRAIVDLRFGEGKAVVVKVGHRQNIYDR